MTRQPSVSMDSMSALPPLPRGSSSCCSAAHTPCRGDEQALGGGGGHGVYHDAVLGCTRDDEELRGNKVEKI
jgi:hypothetical protein